MGLQREIKREKATQQILAVQHIANTAHMAIVAWYRNLTVEEFHELRVAAREENVYIKVIRNRLAHRALEKSNFSCLQPVLKGPILLAFSLETPNSAARLLQNFAANHQNLIVKYLAFEGQLLEGTDLGIMANLPTKEKALANLLNVLQSPLQKLFYLLKEPTTRLSRALTALKNQK